MPKIPFGPTYDEMLSPELIAPEVRSKAIKALHDDELNPINLFNITWKDSTNKVRKVVLPPALTGIDANVVVMLGTGFPSGSHKVGPAYATLIEGIVDGDITASHTILGPSTGNFGIGTAYISKLLGLKAVIIMPDNMSKERYERIKKYGGELDLTPGSESDVILTLERTHSLMKNPQNKALAQFELLSNYRFHRHVTGGSAIAAVEGVGNGRIAGFVSAPGSAGTIAAGDQIKYAFPEAKVAALEPYECSTLANGGRGQHRIEGIGDKMCTLIHNLLTTDFVILIKDEETIQGLKIFHDGLENPYGNVVTSKFNEVQKYLTNTGHVYNANVFIISKVFWDTLTDKEREAIKKAAEESKVYQRKLNEEEDQSSVKYLTEKGMKINDLNPGEKDKIIQILEPIYKQVSTAIGGDFVDRLVKAAK